MGEFLEFSFLESLAVSLIIEKARALVELELSFNKRINLYTHFGHLYIKVWTLDIYPLLNTYTVLEAV
ncbi:hypothetical protein FM107_01510 [Sphingobacterium sp. JB170]|nr:hypothetical protein FM107_01510 [Sphingobacterium sp. JB170]